MQFVHQQQNYQCCSVGLTRIRYSVSYFFFRFQTLLSKHLRFRTFAIESFRTYR